MFVDEKVYNSLSEPADSPWFIGASIKKANRHWNNIQYPGKPDADSLFTVFGALIVAIMISFAASQFDQWWLKQLFIAPLYLVAAACLYLLYRVTYLERLDRHRRKYCSDKYDYSYSRLFFGTDELFVYRSREVIQSNSELCKLIDKYFRATYKADVAIRKDYDNSQSHRDHIDHIVAETEEKYRSILLQAA